jgi:hypothetical protein
MAASRSTRFRAALLALAGAAVLPAAAQAYWRGGFFFGVPGVYVAPPPYLYYPPAYYPPATYPPAWYPPPAYVAPPGPYAPPAPYSTPSPDEAPPPGQACYAGGWICPLEQPTPIGNACSCSTGSGRAWGRAN